MTGKPGRYLSPDESVQLAALESVDRDRLIAFIVADMRTSAVKRALARDARAKKGQAHDAGKTDGPRNKRGRRQALLVASANPVN